MFQIPNITNIQKLNNFQMSHLLWRHFSSDIKPEVNKKKVNLAEKSWNYIKKTGGIL